MRPTKIETGYPAGPLADLDDAALERIAAAFFGGGGRMNVLASTLDLEAFFGFEGNAWRLEQGKPGTAAADDAIDRALRRHHADPSACSLDEVKRAAAASVARLLPGHREFEEGGPTLEDFKQFQGWRAGQHERARTIEADPVAVRSATKHEH